jgi:hypothetical protein
MYSGRGGVAAAGGAADSHAFRCPPKAAMYSGSYPRLGVIVVPFAHAGHILADLPIMAPVIVLAVWFLVAGIRDRRRRERR